MLWTFTVGDVLYRAVYRDERVFSDFPRIDALVEAFVETGMLVNCGEVGPRLAASLDDDERAWGTINTAVVFVADVGSVVAPPSLFPEEVSSRVSIAELVKAQFASRSEAARYAAQQRWKGHVKAEPQAGGDLKERVSALAARAQAIIDLPASRGTRRELSPAEYETAVGVRYVVVVNGDVSIEVPSAEVMRLEADMRALGHSILDQIEGQAVVTTEADRERAIQERQSRLDSLDKERKALEDTLRVRAEKVLTTMTPSEAQIGGRQASMDYEAAIRAFEDVGFGVEDAGQARAALAIGMGLLKDSLKSELDALEERINRAPTKAEARELYDERQDKLARFGDVQTVYLNMDRDRNLPPRKFVPRMSELANERRDVVAREVPAVGKQYADAVGNALRGMGISIGGEVAINEEGAHPSAVEALKDGVSRVIPTRMVEALNSFQKPLTVSNGDGTYSSATHEITGWGSPSVMVHEYIHAVAHKTPFGNLMQAAVFDRRTLGSKDDAIDAPFGERAGRGRQGGTTSWTLPDGTKVGGFKFGDIANDTMPDPYILDKFTDPYAGRVYRNRDSREVLTVGTEQLFGTSYAMRHGAPQDRELMAAAVGFLAVFGALPSTVGKAQFASRSEAGRYAAQQRWKGHIKEEDRGDGLKQRIDALAAEAKVINGMPETMYGEDVLAPEEYGVTASSRSIFVKVKLDDGTVVEVPSERVMRFEAECRAVGEELLKRVEASAPRTSEEDVARFREERTQKLIAADAKISELGERMADVGERLVEAGIKVPTGQKLPITEKIFADAGFDVGSEIEAGALIAALQVQKRFMDQLVALQGTDNATPEQVKALEAKVEAARTIIEFDATFSDKSLSGLVPSFSPWESLVQERRAITRTKPPAVGTRYMDALKGELEKMGIKFGTQPSLVPKFAGGPLGERMTQITEQAKYDVANYVPSRIVDEVTKGGPIYVNEIMTSSGGGSFDPNLKEIETAGLVSTNVHEYTHAVTYAIPVAMGVEQAILARRTFGRKQDALKDKPLAEKLKVGQQKFETRIKYPNGMSMGAGGKYVEILARGGAMPTFKTDKFTDPYAGRVYSRISATNGGETLTVGMEHLIGGGAGLRSGAIQDRDLMASTLGMLVALGRMA